MRWIYHEVGWKSIWMGDVQENELCAMCRNEITTADLQWSDILLHSSATKNYDSSWDRVTKWKKMIKKMIIQKWDQMQSMHVIRWWLCSCIEITPQSLHWFWRLQLSLFIYFDRGHVLWSYYRIRVSKFHRSYCIGFVYNRYDISDSFAVYALVFSTTVLSYWNSTTTTTIVQHHPRFH